MSYQEILDIKNPLIDESIEVSIYLDYPSRKRYKSNTKVKLNKDGLEMVVRRDVINAFEPPETFIVKIDSPLKYRMEKAVNQIL